ncbi:MAG TPA: DUF177 domain-containing protein [Anditalea sp.]|nr:DUF177 domain-containing protein [Anditalea sp.]
MGGSVKFFRAYDIEVIKLKEGKHEFSFDIDDAFLSNFEDNHIVNKGNLKVDLLLSKEANLINTTFNINGKVELTCDRSLELYDQELNTEQKILYKYGPEEVEIDEDIIMITRDTPTINVAQLIYEFIILAIPAKKIHPDYRDDMDEDDFDAEGEVVYRSDDQDGDESADKPNNDADDKTDPRWEALKNLKKKD